LSRRAGLYGLLVAALAVTALAFLAGRAARPETETPATAPAVAKRDGAANLPSLPRSPAVPGLRDASDGAASSPATTGGSLGTAGADAPGQAPVGGGSGGDGAAAGGGAAGGTGGGSSPAPTVVGGGTE
jgi:hypothetical protein